VSVEFTDATLTCGGFHCAQDKMPLKMDKSQAVVEAMSIVRLEPSVKDVSILCLFTSAQNSLWDERSRVIPLGQFRLVLWRMVLVLPSVLPLVMLSSSLSVQYSQLSEGRISLANGAKLFSISYKGSRDPTGQTISKYFHFQ